MELFPLLFFWYEMYFITGEKSNELIDFFRVLNFNFPNEGQYILLNQVFF